MLYARVEYIDRSVNVDFNVLKRILQGRTNACFGGKMNDDVRLFILKYTIHKLAIADIGFNQRITVIAQVILDVAFLNRSIVKRIEIIDGNNFVASGQ